MRARRTHTILAWAHPREHLRGDYDIVATHAEVAQGLSGDLFRPPIGIHVCGIYEVDPVVERRPNKFVGIRLLQRPNLLPHPFPAAERHCTQAKLGNEQSSSS